MKQCTCGCQVYWAHNVYHLDVKVDENGQWLDDGEIYDSMKPFGPFTCNECGKRYDEWEDIPDAPEGMVSEDPVPPEPRKFEAVFLEKPLDEGLNAGDLTWIVSNLNETTFLPLEIQAEHSAAIGLIGLKAAEKLDYSYDALAAAVREIMEDMGKEREDCIYTFHDPKTGNHEFVLTRNHIAF